MKICPQCKNTYTDDSLQFCLQDGTPLTDKFTDQSATADWTESETVISPARRETNNKHTQPTQEWQQSPITNVSAFQPPPKSNKSKILLLAALGLFLFVGIVGAGTYILISNMQKEIARGNNNKGNNNKISGNDQAQNNNTKSAVNDWNTNKSNVNTNPTATPTPKPTLDPEDAAKAKNDVANTIDSWKSASENIDLDSHMSNYANTVDYYNAGKVGIGKVRADKQRAYNMYNSINVDISNINTTIDDSGEKAVSVFDKEWVFENDEKTNSGKVRQELRFDKIGGKWRITSEKDLKVYYVNK